MEDFDTAIARYKPATEEPIATELVAIGSYPGTFFCVRCDQNRWFSQHMPGAQARCAQCGSQVHEAPAPGGLNPTREQLAAMRRREHLDPWEALHRKMVRLGMTVEGPPRG